MARRIVDFPTPLLPNSTVQLDWKRRSRLLNGPMFCRRNRRNNRGEDSSAEIREVLTLLASTPTDATNFEQNDGSSGYPPLAVMGITRTLCRRSKTSARLCQSAPFTLA